MARLDPQRVLIVEDDEGTAALLELYLSDAGYEVIVARDGAQGLDFARHRRPQAVLLDLMLPGMDGRQVCRELRAECDVPILMITARSREKERLEGFDLGADDYITKPFSPREVTRRVRAVLRRLEDRDEAPLLRFRGLELDPSSRRAFADGRVLELTPTEFRILRLLIGSPQHVFTRQRLIDSALGPDFSGQTRSVDAHIGNLRRKLAPGRRPRASGPYIETVVGMGYRLAKGEGS
jgi:DNA-binding response OmpR family regulator